MSVANYFVVPSGSSWSTAQSIITEAQAAYDNDNIRQTVLLPNESMAITNYLEITGNPVRITGIGPNSELVVSDDVHIPGSDVLINLVFTDGTELDHFKLTFNRAALGESSRKTAILVNWGSYNIDLHHLTINGATSDIFRIAAEYASPSGHDITDIRIYSNAATEWYESYCLIRSGEVSNVKVFDNTGSTSAGHPTESISRPYGVGIGQEEFWALEQNILFANNTMTSTASASVANPSLGIFCTWSSGATQDNAKVNRVCFKDNIVSGWVYNGLTRLINRPCDAKTQMVWEGNAGSSAIQTNFLFQPTDGDDGSYIEQPDELVIVRNTGGVTIDTTQLGPFTGPVITQVDNS